MDKDWEQTIRTNWHLKFINDKESEVYELITISGNTNISALMKIVRTGFEYSEEVDEDWCIVLTRNSVNHNIDSLDDIEYDTVLKKFKSFEPENDYHRPDIYKNGVRLDGSEIEQISINLVPNVYSNKLKHILGLVFNTDESKIVLE